VGEGESLPSATEDARSNRKEDEEQMISCHALQKRLDELNGRIESLSEAERSHIARCASCSKALESINSLGQLFETVTTDQRLSEVPLMPLEARVNRVVAQVEGSGFGLKLADWFRRRFESIWWNHRRLTMSGGLVAALLLLVTLIPIGQTRVVGYNLTLGGICPEVAADEAIVCAMLHEQGVDQAVIGVANCDITCSLVLFDLKSEREIELALATYEELGAEAVVEDITAVTNRESRSLLSLAHEKIFSN
jgi:hypothetical protein